MEKPPSHCFIDQGGMGYSLRGELEASELAALISERVGWKLAATEETIKSNNMLLRGN